MKKYGKQFVIVLAVAVVLLALSAVFRFLVDANSLDKAMEDQWGLVLPSGYEVEYRAATDNSEEESGLWFYALLYSESEALDAWLPWGDSSQPTDYAGSGAEAAAEILTALGVPGGEWPDWETAGMWYASREDGSEMLIFHTPGDFRLYLVESYR